MVVTRLPSCNILSACRLPMFSPLPPFDPLPPRRERSRREGDETLPGGGEVPWASRTKPPDALLRRSLAVAAVAGAVPPSVFSALVPLFPDELMEFFELVGSQYLPDLQDTVQPPVGHLVHEVFEVRVDPLHLVHVQLGLLELGPQGLPLLAHLVVELPGLLAVRL